MLYFSERETGEQPRDVEEIDATVWKGLLALIRSRVVDGSFGAKYPEICEDGTFICGADMAMFDDAMRAEIPELADYSNRSRSRYWQSTLDTLRNPDNQPSTVTVLDLVEFCWKSLGKPRTIEYHSFFSHSHLAFDEEAGQDEFRDQVETIFRRNGVAYEFTNEGRIERLVPPVFRGALIQPGTTTGDVELDRLIATAKRKFLDLHYGTRRESLEALWDAWERLKTLDGEGDKKSQVKSMLDKTAGTASPKFREAIEQEARNLTDIGNNLRIRHSETNQEVLARNEHVDYLFYRLFSLIQLTLLSK